MRILSYEVAVNTWDASLRFLLRNSSNAGEGIAMSDRRTKTDSEHLQPPAEEMCRQHTDQGRRT